MNNFKIMNPAKAITPQIKASLHSWNIIFPIKNNKEYVNIIALNQHTNKGFIPDEDLLFCELFLKGKLTNEWANTPSGSASKPDSKIFL